MIFILVVSCLEYAKWKKNLSILSFGLERTRSWLLLNRRTVSLVLFLDGIWVSVPVGSKGACCWGWGPGIVCCEKTHLRLEKNETVLEFAALLSSQLSSPVCSEDCVNIIAFKAADPLLLTSFSITDAVFLDFFSSLAGLSLRGLFLPPCLYRNLGSSPWLSVTMATSLLARLLNLVWVDSQICLTNPNLFWYPVLLGQRNLAGCSPWGCSQIWLSTCMSCLYDVYSFPSCW